MVSEQKKILLTGRGKLEYTLQRKKMKNMRLKVDGDKTILSCGLTVKQKAIDEFIERQWQWIQNAKSRQCNKLTGIMPVNFTDGEGFYFLGVPCKIRCIPAARQKAELKDGYLIVQLKHVDPDVCKKIFQNWLVKMAREVYAERLISLYPQYSREIGAQPEITLRKMKTRWGSAHTKKRIITLNTALIHTPVALIDYVIAHELAHFIHPNHSRDFYEVLSAHMPDWKLRKKTLNTGYMTSAQ